MSHNTPANVSSNPVTVANGPVYVTYQMKLYIKIIRLYLSNILNYLNKSNVLWGSFKKIMTRKKILLNACKSIYYDFTCIMFRDSI